VSRGAQVEIEGNRLELSNLDKVLYPKTGFTKAQVIDYYSRVGPMMLPHLRGRPVTLKRYPDGVEEEYFYEKECPAFHSDWVSIKTIASMGPKRKRDQVNYCVINNLASLVWVANLASLELHTLLALDEDITRPTMVAFDLDPGEGATVIDCVWAAFELKSILKHAGLRCFPKTSGGKGLHVYVPLNAPTSFGRTKAFARAIAKLLEREHPDRVTSVMRKDLRGGRIFVDWSQNDPHKTTVCAYSLRARDRPTVSTPVTWKELEIARAGGDPTSLTFEAGEVLERIRRRDLFAQVLTLEQELPSAPGE
jgi:bifunctional non-homologous end joining protein LigD